MPQAALWKSISQWFDRTTKNPELVFYARYSAIVQSSGTGKSRTVDELSKSHFVIPVNLLDRWDVRYCYLLAPSFLLYAKYSPPRVSSLGCSSLGIPLRNPDTARGFPSQLAPFFTALFAKTTLELEKIQEGTVAARFREYMKKDMKQESHGENRQKFNEDVVSKAKV
ncbi:hypothetical protein J3R83DRAFT_11609 [Lanmaoa asiatica]|nr:hypothetical protein J3R83DRAFT_11609 [Lanmaoa asiatica]